MDRSTTREWKDRTDCTESLHVENTPQSKMSDHTDGPEAAAAGKKRMLEGHAGGPHGERRQHEERAVTLDNVSGLATAPAPYPSASKKPRKAPDLCEHLRQRSRCKDCCGSGLCEHQRVRSQCKDCGGSSFCEHQRQRSTCKDCGGSSVCEHQRQRSTCKDCGGSGICEHQRVRSRCKDCGGSGLCEHQRRRYRCKDCKKLKMKS